ncbi:MAG: hypothetical protein QGG40_15635 [Myxococcota bacterium]|nr:hypothetical protein [Myxococcota bacterium]
MVRWGYIFLACPSGLADEQRRGLLELAARAWFSDEDPVRFDWGDCRGEIRATSDTVALGAFYGQKFTGEVHLLDQSYEVRFLVAEKQLRAMGGAVAEA